VCLLSAAAASGISFPCVDFNDTVAPTHWNKKRARGQHTYKRKNRKKEEYNTELYNNTFHSLAGVLCVLWAACLVLITQRRSNKHKKLDEFFIVWFGLCVSSSYTSRLRFVNWTSKNFLCVCTLYTCSVQPQHGNHSSQLSS
jgi:hypothetical protein